jgi:hypothetical protein
VELEFSGEIWFWKGPAPWYFITVPETESDRLSIMAAAVTYGWGMIPVSARIGKTGWTTSLFPKDGLYALPIKSVVRKAEKLDVGNSITVHLTVEAGIF